MNNGKLTKLQLQRVKRASETTDSEEITVVCHTNMDTTSVARANQISPQGAAWCQTLMDTMGEHEQSYL